MTPAFPTNHGMNGTLGYAKALSQTSKTVTAPAIIPGVVGTNEANVIVRQFSLSSCCPSEVYAPAIDGVPNVVFLRSGPEMARIETPPVITCVQNAGALAERQTQTISNGIGDHVNTEWSPFNVDLPITASATSNASVWPFNASVSRLGNGVDKKVISSNVHRLSPPVAHGAKGRGSRKATALSHFSEEL